jgi:hypothetical protein
MLNRDFNQFSTRPCHPSAHSDAAFPGRAELLPASAVEAA